MTDQLLMLARVGDDRHSREYSYVRIPIGYDRARRLLTVMEQARILAQEPVLNLVEIIFVDPEPVEFISDPKFNDPDNSLGTLATTLVNRRGGHFVRSDFPFSSSIRADLPDGTVLATVTPGYLYWSAWVYGLQRRSVAVRIGEILKALCMLAPADEVPSYFRRLVQIDPIASAKCLQQGGFFLDEPNIDRVWPLPSFSPDDLAPLLSHEDRWVREAAIAALGHVNLTPQSRNRAR